MADSTAVDIISAAEVFTEAAALAAAVTMAEATTVVAVMPTMVKI